MGEGLCFNAPSSRAGIRGCVESSVKVTAIVVSVNINIRVYQKEKTGTSYSIGLIITECPRALRLLWPLDKIA